MAAVNRVRYLVSRQGLTIAAVLALLGVASVTGAMWVFANPPVDTVTAQTDVQTIDVSTGTSAIVTGNSTLYEDGERLEDMPIYFLESSPNLTISIATTTPDDVTTTVSRRLILEQRATRNGQEFFSTNRTLVRERVDVSDGRTTTSTTIDMSELRRQIDRNRAEIGSVGAYQTELVLVVDYETDKYEGGVEASAPVVFSSGGYWLDGSLSDSREHSRSVTRQEPRPAHPATYGGLGLFGLLALAGAVGMLYARQSIDVDPYETAFYHDEYEEWISEGEFPTGTDKRYIKINNLEDLVDIAIDSNKRVIYDPSLDVYCVVDDDLVYYFSKDPFNIDVWLDA